MNETKHERKQIERTNGKKIIFANAGEKYKLCVQKNVKINSPTAPPKKTTFKLLVLVYISICFRSKIQPARKSYRQENPVGEKI